MRLIIRPLQEPSREIDVTHRLTATIAEELWRRYGGEDQGNWSEAEMHLGRIIESANSQGNHEALEAAREAGRAEARREMEAERERLFLMVTRMDGSAAAGFDALSGRRWDTDGDVRRAKRRDTTGREARGRDEVLPVRERRAEHSPGSRAASQRRASRAIE